MRRRDGLRAPPADGRLRRFALRMGSWMGGWWGRPDEQVRGIYELGRRHEHMRRTYELGRRDEQTKLVGQTRSASERNIRAGETRWGSERNIRAGQTGWGEARENAFFRRSHVLVVYLQSAGGRRSQHGLHGRVRGVLHGRVRRRLAVSSHHRRIMSCPVARDAGRAPVGRHDGVGSRQPMRLTKRVPK